MNFTPDSNGTMSDTASWWWGPTALTGQTPWLGQGDTLGGTGILPEIVTDPSNGNTYYHMIMGDPSTGFVQESYVQMGFGGYGNVGEPAGAASASGGTGTYITRTSTGGATTMLGNGYDPLDMNANIRAQNVTSGNGTANPNRVIMRQIVSDGEIMMEFLKDKYEYKPRVTQILVNPDLLSIFDMDMRNINYSDMNTAALVLNVQELVGENLSGTTALFDMSSDSQNSTVTGGKYTYTPGAGFGGAEGTYSYTSGGFDQTAISWKDVFDANAVNPWSFEEAKPAP